MLQDEKVNDYDIYFRNKETAEAVARYYVKVFNEENDENAAVVINGDRVTIEWKPNQSSKWVKAKYFPVFLSSNAITLTSSVQMIIRFYGEPNEIHKNYDFVHCTNYWTSWDKKLVLSPNAVESILTKELIYQGSLYPVSSVIRTKKFIEKGWSINAGQYLKMCYQTSKLDLNNPEVLRDQLGGIDASLFTEVVRKCQEDTDKDPSFVITPEYLFDQIDTVFS